MSQQLAEAGVTSSRYGSGTAHYHRPDRLDPIVNDRWAKDGGSDLYSTDITFDESGNITRQVDNLQRNYGGGSNPGVFDASYTIDSRSRLTRTQEGHWNGSSISTLWRDQQWTLSQTGNWARDKEDWNGDTDFTDTGEVDDTRAHNVANELLTRDTDSNSSVNYTLTHDAVGNLTDDGKDYKFVYDAFGRLRTVKNQSNTVVTEYTYNGLNMRIGWHSDADADADVDGSDPWYSFAHDDRWRIVATFRGSDTSPKELFAYHNAGANGRGGSSYIDSVILRNKDANTSWTAASDGTLEERIYYAQNWRADVSAVLSSAGLVKEWVKYTSYGIPVRIDPGDYNRDGFVNGTDFDDYGDDFDNARAEADVNFDGSVNGDDYDLFSAWWDAPSTASRFTLSASSVGNRVGYAGYQYDPTFVGASRAIYHVRNRVYDAGLGRWMRRDPAGYVDGISLASYCQCTPLIVFDAFGFFSNNKGNPSCENGSSNPSLYDGGMTKESCEDRAKDTWPRCSQRVIRLIELIKNCPNSPCSDIKIECKDNCDAGCARKDPKDPNAKVVAYRQPCGFAMCYENHSNEHVCDTVAHELVHVYDFACNNSGSDCGSIACTEIRAYSLSCGGNAWKRDGYTSFNDCVVKGAKSSVRIMGCDDSIVDTKLADCLPNDKNPPPWDPPKLPAPGPGTGSGSGTGGGVDHD